MPDNDNEQDRRDRERPRRVKWASKNLVEHFEHVPLKDEDAGDVDEHSKALDEYGRDPAAIAKLHRALEAYSTPVSESKPAPRARNTRRLRDAPSFHDDSSSEAIAESSRQGALRNAEAEPEQSADEDVYIDPDETAGMPLPLSPNTIRRLRQHGDIDEAEIDHYAQEERRYWERRAREMVVAYSQGGAKTIPTSESEGTKAHHGFFHLRRRHKGKERWHEKEKEPDIEAGPVGESENIKPLPLGGEHGVLGTLLSLYHRQSPSVSSADLTEVSTTPSTPYETDRESILSSDGHLIPKDEQPIRSYFDKNAPKSTGVSSGRSDFVPYRSYRPDRRFSASPSPATCTRKLTAHIPRISPGAHIHIPTPHPSPGIPKATQNAGGVIGALIATTNNLAGPAAPAASTIGPDVSRRGYRLSRYGFKSGIPLPPSRPHSVPGTPPSSPTSGTETTGETPPLQPPASRRPKRLAWMTEVKPDARAHMKAEKKISTYEKRSRAFEEGKAHGKSYRKAKKDGRKKAEIYITKHVAEVLQRQEFILKLARALMMFAGPGHRLQAILAATGRVLDIEISSLHLPNVILISFGDSVTSTSNVKLIQQGGPIDLEKLMLTQKLYWKVIHDDISVSSASASLDLLMNSPTRYNRWQVILVGGLCSSAICSLSFSGSFADSLMVFPMGAFLVVAQMASIKNELFTNVFEIAIATLLSFLAAALASTKRFCYAALASSSVVLILPGFIILSGSLELASRQIISGAVRTCFAIIYSLFLGFGLSMGAVIYTRITGLHIIGPDDFTCGVSHDPHGPWWQQPVSLWWAFLTVPLFALALSLRNQSPIWRREMAITVFIACGGWAANHFSGYAFKNRPDIQSAIGALVVGLVANLYGKFFYGNAYVVMITGILFQLPSGLANGGLLVFAAKDENSQKSQSFSSYEDGFKVAAQLIAVAIGLTVGLFVSVVIVHPLGGGRRRAAGLFSL